MAPRFPGHSRSRSPDPVVSQDSPFAEPVRVPLLVPPQPYPAQGTQSIEPILIPKLRIRLAEFPYATLFYAPETAHLGDLMRIRYGWIEAQRIVTQPLAFLG